MFFEEVIPNSKTSPATVTISSTDFPYARSGHRLAAYGPNLYCIGGFNPELWSENNSDETYYPLFKEVWSFNVQTKKWSKLKMKGHVPVELASHSTLVHNNYLLVFGGTGVPFGQCSSNELHALNLATLTWTQLPCTGQRPHKQYGHAAVLNGNDLYIIGGTSGFEYNMDVFHLNLNDPQLEWKKLNRNVCRGRYRHEAIFNNNYLLVFGGGTSTEVCSMTVIDVFDLLTGCWQTITTKPDPKCGFPLPRRCHGLAREGNYVYITGGTNGGAVFDDIWRYDISKNCWNRLNVFMPHRVFFHSTTATEDGCLYSFGGVLNDENTERSCQLYRFWLSPPPLMQLAMERVCSICPSFDLSVNKFELPAESG